jgi:hypothetical protein
VLEFTAFYLLSPWAVDSWITMNETFEGTWAWPFGNAFAYAEFMAILILLNGPPASGKSTIAQRFVNTHPLALNLDIDVVRGLLVSGLMILPLQDWRHARSHWPWRKPTFALGEMSSSRSFSGGSDS